MIYQYRKKKHELWTDCTAEQYNSMVGKPPFKNNFEFRTVAMPEITPEELLENQKRELEELDAPKKPKKPKNLD